MNLRDIASVKLRRSRLHFRFFLQSRTPLLLSAPACQGFADCARHGGNLKRRVSGPRKRLAATLRTTPTATVSRPGDECNQFPASDRT